MRRLLKWVFGILAVLLIPIALLLSPVIYVETLCRGEAEPRPYRALLADEHHRAESRTLMTYPEWHIVHAYEDYARVIDRRAPHDFGYLRSIAGFWSSLCDLSKSASSLGEIDTETKQMVHVIGVSFTAELALKALYEETLGRAFVWLRGATRAPLDDLSARQAKDYARFLQQVPWYKWRFREDAEQLEEAATGALRDRERALALGLEYRAKAAYAGVIAQAVASTGADEQTLRMVVTGANRAGLEALGNIEIVGETADGIVIETPRYRALTNLLLSMAQQGLDFVEIAGNDQIMFTALSDKATHRQALSSMERQGFGNYRHLILVEVSELAERLRTLGDDGLTLEHVHDY